MKSCYALIVFVLLWGGAFAASTPPNIILMYIDDLDFDQISVYPHREFPSYTGAKDTGNLKHPSPVTAYQNGRFLKPGEMNWAADPRMLTPHIESLAATGVTLNRFYVTSSTCTPSRYSLLTGRYASAAPAVLLDIPPPQTPIIAWNSHLTPDEGHLAKDLQKAGYTTALIGKWHLGDYDIEGVDFDSGYLGHHVSTGTNQGKRPFQLVASYFPLSTDPADPDVQNEMGRIYRAMVRKVQQVSGFDVVDRLYYANTGGIPLPGRMKVHNLEWITEGALEFIDANRDRPFFLYFCPTAPHGQYFEDWMAQDPRATPAGMLQEVPKGMPTREDLRQRVLAAGLPLQNSMATWIDDSVGAILQKLEEHGLSDNTIVLFLSDHQSRGKLTVYEGARAPAIIRWPGRLQSGTTDRRLTANVDIRPTLLEAAGVHFSEDEIHGQNLFPESGVENPAWRTSLLLETGYSRAVVTEQWKYIAHRPPQDVRERMEQDRIRMETEGGRRHVGWTGRRVHPSTGIGVRFNADEDFPHYFDPDQVYNLEEDVFEQNNLYGSEEGNPPLEDLKEMLHRHLQQLPHPFGEFGGEESWK